MSVSIAGVVVRPWDFANLEWDGNSTVNSLLRNEISNLLIESGEPNAVAAGVIARIAGAGLSATVAPDVYGSATLRFNGVDYPGLTATLTPTEEDAFTVAFVSAPGWTLSNGLIRIGIALVDRDFGTADDPIGTIYLSEEDLRQAWNAAPDALTWVQVSSQMQATLFVRLRVRAEP